MEPSVLVFERPLSLGLRVRLLRVARDWRQWELAFHAQVPPSEVSALERDLPTYRAARLRILKVLDLEDSP